MPIKQAKNSKLLSDLIPDDPDRKFGCIRNAFYNVNNIPEEMAVVFS
jgi:hypothetical protein